MLFALPFIFVFAGLAITLKILIGYNPEVSLKYRLTIAGIVVFSWFAPMIARFLRRLHIFSTEANQMISQTCYVLFVTVFFLLCFLMIRDIFWIFGYKIARKLKKATPSFDPMNPATLKKANIVTAAAALLLSGYAVYEGVKFPDIKETAIYTQKLNSAFKIVALTDMHITPATPISRINKIVETVNGLKPDIIVLVGDIVDSKIYRLNEETEALAKFKAKYGVYVTLGNHEFYHGSLRWERKFKEMGFFPLANSGVLLGATNVSLNGLPDPNLLRLNDITMAGIRNNLRQAPSSSYRIFLSHSPRFIKRLNKDLIDLQISGHTHGGQIFPFHFLVKRFNDFVAGLYDVNGMKLYVSRGVSGWGPPMRLFAPSEIAVIDLIPEKKN